MLKTLSFLILLFSNIFYTNSFFLFDFIIDFLVSVSFFFIIKIFIIFMDILASLSSYFDSSDFIALIFINISIRLILENSLTKVFLNNLRNWYVKIKLKLVFIIVFLITKRF